MTYKRLRLIVSIVKLRTVFFRQHFIGNVESFHGSASGYRCVVINETLLQSLTVPYVRQQVVNWYQQVPRQLILCLDCEGFLPKEKKPWGADQVAESAPDGLVTAASTVFISLVVLYCIDLSGIRDSLNLGIKELATTSLRFPLRGKNLQPRTISGDMVVL